MRWRRVLADLRRPEAPTPRRERGFLIGSCLAILTIAQVSDPGSLLDLLMLSPALLGFVLRAEVPRLPAEVFALLVLVPVALVVGHEGDLEGTFFMFSMVVVYTAWHLGSMTRALVVLAAGAGAPLLVSAVLVPESGILWTPWTSAAVFTFALGRLLRRQQSLIDQLEQAREALAEQAVAEERRRMARELHDLAGHTLAAVLLHVTGARHVLRRDLDEAERALRDAEAVGRSSLDQIRATVAALRTHERGTDAALAASADVTELVAEYRRAGLVIDADVTPAVGSLSEPLGTAVHRIVREALANVARHAPTNSVEVGVAVDGPWVHLRVVDRGRPGTQPDGDTAHFGLVGMRERALALGGELEAGPTADGWRLAARLPATWAPAPGARGHVGVET